MSRKFVFHPFLFAAYPVLFLFSQNIQEFRLDVLVVPLLAVILISAFIMLFLTLFVRHFVISAILTSFIIISLFYYQRITGMIEKIPYLTKDSLEQWYLFGVFILFVSLVFVLLRFREQLISVNKLLCIISAILIIFPLFSIISYEGKTGRMWDMHIRSSSTVSVSEKNNTDPDIYYIIFDRYAGKQALSEQYGFDNSDFYTYLEKKGFYVANEARTNYPKTFLSLASSLNMEYLDKKTAQFKEKQGGDESVMTPLIRNSEVLRFLKKRGYTTVNIGSWWTPTQKNEYADVNYFLKNDAYFGADEFTIGYINTTLAAAYLPLLFKDETAVSSDPQNNIHRNTILYELNAIKRASEIKGPKFVFVHLTLPHDPFVFDKNCTPIAETVVKKNSHQINYIEQLQCANRKAKDMIDYLLSKQENTVIILQSDEGPFPMNVPIPEKQGWGTAETTSLREKFPILQTYHVPGDTSQFYSSISPVNSFRAVFNSVFGTTYPFLPDRSYVFESEDAYYNFTDVTDRVK